MANTTFISAPTSGSGNASDENIKWQNGTIQNLSGQITPDLGSSQVWKNDVSWQISRKDSKFINDDDAYYFSGENGKEHWANYYVSSNLNGLYPQMELISGFGLSFNQNSTAGHGMHVRRFGITMYKKSTDSYLLWGSNSRSRSSSIGWQHVKYSFSESDKTAIQGYRFAYFMFQVSSEGGTGTRTTQVGVGNFRLIYNAGDASSTNRWVVGKYRNIIDADIQAIQGK